VERLQLQERFSIFSKQSLKTAKISKKNFNGGKIDLLKIFCPAIFVEHLQLESVPRFFQNNP
jgi:hypothetical protein